MKITTDFNWSSPMFHIIAEPWRFFEKVERVFFDYTIFNYNITFDQGGAFQQISNKPLYAASIQGHILTDGPHIIHEVHEILNNIWKSFDKV